MATETPHPFTTDDNADITDVGTATSVAAAPGRRPRTIIAASLAATVALVAVAAQIPSGSSAQAGAVPARAAAVETDDLGALTLDELADELADLGLTLRIDPTGTDTNGPDENIDAEDLDSSAEDAAIDDVESPDAESPDIADFQDPFEGLTDDQIDALSDDEFESRLEEAGWILGDDGYYEPGSDAVAEGSDQSDTAPGEHDHDHGADEVLGAFPIDGDRIDVSNSHDAKVAEQAQAIWNRFARLIPADQRQMVNSFELNPAEASGAYVYPDETDPTKWVLGVSLGLGEDLDYVLIHEFAHLLTLQASEVPPAAGEDNSCPTYFTGEGCALSGSTIAEFVSRFWPQSQLDTIFALQDAEDYDGLDEFYRNNSDAFVTDYATTNPAEDLAETFAVFVTTDRPTGNTIADQKLELLWNDPAMVALRDQIRANR